MTLNTPENPDSPTRDPAPLDPVALAILDHLASLPADKSATPDEAARVYAELRRKPSDGRDLYKRYQRAVREQAIFLARQGRIEILRRGEPVDPDDFKGVWRMRLKK